MKRRENIKKSYDWLQMLLLAVSATVFFYWMSCAVYAQEQYTVLEQVEVEYVNPLHSDEIAAPAQDQPTVSARSYSNKLLAEAPAYYSDLASAGAELRRQMVKRSESPALYFKTTEWVTEEDRSSLTKQLFEEALKHTGVSTEGDYLRWQYGRWHANVSGYQENATGTYYYTISYQISYYTTADQEQIVSEEIARLETALDLKSMSAFSQIQTIYNYICENVQYDQTGSDTLKHTAYAALVNESAVCQGYALLFYRMALDCGIDARLISGYAAQSGIQHGWNIVKIGELYYYADSTWDAGKSEFKYFLKGQTDFKDHVLADSGALADTSALLISQYPMADSAYTVNIAQENDDLENLENPEENDTSENSENSGENTQWTPLTTGNGSRIYFYNMTGDGRNSITGEADSCYTADCIIVESNGHFGLIDAGHRYEDYITDEDGTEYYVPNHTPDGAYSALSSQVEGKNGKDAAAYMHDTLGITHLDFVLATHAHSDHIGGMPDVANYTYIDEDGKEAYLIDEHTVYLCKAYRHVSAQDDDLGSETRADSWHNQAYVYQAEKTMRARGAVVVDVSNGLETAQVPGEILNYDTVVRNIQKAGSLGNVDFDQGDIEDFYDDYITFTFGSLEIRLYNLFFGSNAINENMNSIAAVITDGSMKVFSAGDIDAEWRTEQKIAKAVYDDFGPMDVVKASHHGAVHGANTKDFIDYFQPKYIVTPGTKRIANSSSAFAAAMYYSTRIRNYTRAIYEVGYSDRAIVVSFEESTPAFYELQGEGSSARFADADHCINRLPYKDGWYIWDIDYYTGTDEKDYMYFRDGEAVIGWESIGNDRYFFNADGLRQTGWHQENNNTWYYLKPNGTMAEAEWQYVNGKWYYFASGGQMQTGWHQENGNVWYYLKPDGTMAEAEWQYVNGKWYHFTSSGRMQTGWYQENKNTWYYLKPDGAMAADEWQYVNGKWYHFASSGRMQTGWYQENPYTWYYLKPDGTMAEAEWQYVNGKWYHFTSSGRMQTGWYQDNSNTWYYLKPDGAMAEAEWQYVNGKWYYFVSGGRMVSSGWQYVDGKWYHFDDNGRMQTGWYQENPYTWYYLKPNGMMAAAEWEYVNGKWYHFASNGHMQTGWLQDGGIWYYFDGANGMMYANGTYYIHSEDRYAVFNANGAFSRYMLNPKK